jgi:hypothetical protein
MVPSLISLSKPTSPVFLQKAKFYRVKRDFNYSHKTALSTTRGPIKQVATSVWNA